MSKVNAIQAKIQQLEGGAFQALFDAYLYKKCEFDNIQTLGIQTGTNKTTKGVPDSYVRTKEGKYILINYGSVSQNPIKKMKDDILSSFKVATKCLEKDKIERIICGYSSTNITLDNHKNIIESIKSIEGVEVELIGIDTLSYDLAFDYPYIAKDYLGISIGTNQIFEIEDFVKFYDDSGINSPLDCDFLYREDDINQISKSIDDNTITILTGPSGIGKTRLALEVCRLKSNEDTKVYCVRSNGNLLYEDIPFYIDTPGKYLILFDDANMITSWDSVLQTLFRLPNDYEIKILITVREYAQERVINGLSKYLLCEPIKIKKFKDDEIKAILKANLQITHQQYLKKIAKIAKGNIRVAYLAGKLVIREGSRGIQNVKNIFNTYYTQIIQDTKLAEEDIIMLFLIAVVGPVRTEKNNLYSDLKDRYGKEINEHKVREKLYSLELIDCFETEIINISDQSLGNYIMYYVLFEKKWISIEELIIIAFPDYKNKIIYILNTLIEIFYSVELINYINKSIISAWNNAPQEQQLEYLESFYQVDIDKSLSIIYEHICKEKDVNFDLHDFNIKDKQNYHSITAKEIEILGGYKNTDSFEDAIDLLIMYFKKRPDLIMDFYFVIKDYLRYDAYSYHYNYQRERALLNKLWQASEEGENYSLTFLYLHILKYALDLESSFYESNNKTITISTISCDFNEHIVEMRSMIWKTLGVLRKKGEYRKDVNNILLNISFNGLNIEDQKSYLQSDFDAIMSTIIDEKELDFFDAQIIDRYRQVAEGLGVIVDVRYFIAEKNSEFKIYKMLLCKYSSDGTFKDFKKNREDYLNKKISSYQLKDYKKLFAICRFLEENAYDHKRWELDTALESIFEKLEQDKKLYVNVIKEYFIANMPFRLSGRQQIRYLLGIIGYEKTLELVNKIECSKKNIWLSYVWECCKEEKYLTDKIVSDYKNFIITHNEKCELVIPSVQMFKIYGEKDNDLKNYLMKKIANRQALSYEFLSRVYTNEDTETIFDIFNDDIDILSTIYVNARRVNDTIDYDSKLFIELLKRRPITWKDYIDDIKERAVDIYNKPTIFERVWHVDNYEAYIEYAFNILIDSNIGTSIENPAKLLFGETEYKGISDKQKQWLLNELYERRQDNEKCIKVLDVVVNARPEWKLEFILKFLEYNKQIIDFKKIKLFPSSYFGTGSLIPMFMEKRKFLELLKSNLKGIDFIYHKNDLNKSIQKIEKRIEQEKIDEYIRNSYDM